MEFNLEFYILCYLKATPNNVDVGDKGMQKGGEMLSPCIERSNVWELKRGMKRKGRAELRMRIFQRQSESEHI